MGKEGRKNGRWVGGWVGGLTPVMGCCFSTFAYPCVCMVTISPSFHPPPRPIHTSSTSFESPDSPLPSQPPTHPLTPVMGCCFSTFAYPCVCMVTISPSFHPPPRPIHTSSTSFESPHSPLPSQPPTHPLTPVMGCCFSTFAYPCVCMVTISPSFIIAKEAPAILPVEGGWVGGWERG